MGILEQVSCHRVGFEVHKQRPPCFQAAGVGQEVARGHLWGKGAIVEKGGHGRLEVQDSPGCEHRRHRCGGQNLCEAGDIKEAVPGGRPVVGGTMGGSMDAVAPVQNPRAGRRDSVRDSLFQECCGTRQLRCHDCLPRVLKEVVVIGGQQVVDRREVRLLLGL